MVRVRYCSLSVSASLTQTFPMIDSLSRAKQPTSCKHQEVFQFALDGRAPDHRGVSYGSKQMSIVRNAAILVERRQSGLSASKSDHGERHGRSAVLS